MYLECNCLLNSLRALLFFFRQIQTQSLKIRKFDENTVTLRSLIHSILIGYFFYIDYSFDYNE